MIQRIQSIYLFIAVLLCGIGAYLVPQWESTTSSIMYKQDYIAYGYLGLAILILIVLFSYKNRSLQMKLTRLTIFLNLVLLGFFVYWFLNLPGENNYSTLFSKKGIGAFFPIVSIVFLRMACRAIKRDDDLVKSANRFR